MSKLKLKNVSWPIIRKKIEKIENNAENLTKKFRSLSYNILCIATFCVFRLNCCKYSKKNKWRRIKFELLIENIYPSFFSFQFFLWSLDVFCLKNIWGLIFFLKITVLLNAIQENVNNKNLAKMNTFFTFHLIQCTDNFRKDFRLLNLSMKLHEKVSLKNLFFVCFFWALFLAVWTLDRVVGVRTNMNLP